MRWIRYILCFSAGVGLSALVFSQRPGHENPEKKAPASTAKPVAYQGKRQAPQVPGSSSPNTLSDIFAEVNTEDYLQLLEEAKLEGNELHGLISQYMLLFTWAQRDPSGALDYFSDKNLSDETNEILITAALRGQGLSNLPVALEWIANNVNDPSMRNSFTSELYAGIASDDPVAALDLIKQLPASMNKEYAIEEIIESWAKKDLDSAFSWLEQQSPNPEVYSMYSTLMFSYVEQNPTTAHALIDQLYPSDLKDDLLDACASTMAENDPTAAITWAMGLDEEMRKDAIGTVFDTWSTTDFDGAYAFALNLEDEELRTEIIAEMGQLLAYTDPAQLAERLDEFAPTEQEELIRDLAETWLEQDPEKALQWVENQPESSLQNEIYALAAYQYMDTNLTVAWDMANSVSDVERRAELISDIAPSFYPYNPDEVVARIEADPGLSQEKKDTLLSALTEIEPVDMLLP